MVGTSASSLSSCASLDDVSVLPTEPVKLLCSYGGKILPRRPDGRLRYVGGHTRVLAVRRSISFSELQVKLRELCGWGAVSLRCQLPTEDMDALVSITSDEDLANLVEEYDLASRDRRSSPLKIRAFLLLLRASEPSCRSPVDPVAAAERCVRQASLREKLHSWCEKPDASAAAAGDLRVHGHATISCTTEDTGNDEMSRVISSSSFLRNIFSASILLPCCAWHFLFKTQI